MKTYNFMITAFKSERSTNGMVYMMPFDTLAREIHEGTLLTLSERVQTFKQELINSNNFDSNNGFSVGVSLIGKQRKPINFELVKRSLSSNYIA